MKSFFLFQNRTIIFILLLLVLTLLFQIFLIIDELTVMWYQNTLYVKIFQDIIIVFYLIVGIKWISECFYHLAFQTLYFPATFYMLYSLWGTMFSISLITALYTHKPTPLITPFSLFFVLPVSEDLFPILYPSVLLLPVACLCFRALKGIIHYRNLSRRTLSAFSLKEAIDGINFGLLLYRSEGRSKGQILLCNNKMHQLMMTMTGEIFYNGTLFQNRLKEGHVKHTIRKDTFHALPVFHLPDGTIWQFQTKQLSGNASFHLFFASEVTNIFNATDRLCESREELRERQKELESLLNNLESLCRQEELLEIKGHVHDLLGHRISLILRALREHQEPDFEALSNFSKSLIPELKKTSVSPDYSFKRLQKDFDTLGVSLHTHGAFPSDALLRKTVYDICLEATSNAIRHGYATDIYIEMQDKPNAFTLSIINNGITVPGPVTEGGGLKGMRKKTLELGGIFFYKTTPDFTVEITFPKGEIL